MRRWLKIRRLSRYHRDCRPEAVYLNELYGWLHIVTDFRKGLEAIGE